MMRTLPFTRGVQHRVLAGLLLTITTACSGGDDPLAPAPPIAGSYRATTFRVVPTGQPELDVLAQGGSLTVTIDDDLATTGTLVIPAALNGGRTLTESMVGTARQVRTTVTFNQTADSFVRDLDWTVDGRTLRVTNQTAGGAAFTITLTR